MTGAELAARIEAGARERGLGLHAFLAALTSEPSKWLSQIRQVQRPRQHTLDRVEKLLAGEPAPPPPPNNFQAPARRGEPRARPLSILDRTPRLEKVEHLRVDRDACFLCGTRGDIGCRHKRRAA